jgi:2-iminobutanoate/2-iminopropanoate deaminase
MEIVQTDNAPKAIGPYSQAIKSEHYVFTAGQIPLDPATGKLVEGDIRVQAKRVLDNLRAVLDASGSSLGRVVKTTCFLADMADFPAFNEVYSEYFAETKPARSTVQVAQLPLNARVEVECIALLSSQ